MSDCCFTPGNDIQYILLEELRSNYEKLKNDTTARLLIQDGKIADTCVYIKENLSTYLADMLNTMDSNGELKDIITNVLLAELTADIEKTNVFYEGITTDKIFDNASSCYYYLSKIPRKDKNGLPIKLKMGIANDDPTFSALEPTLKHAWRKNATLCINCGVFNVDTKKPIACIIYNGEILYRDIPTETPEKYQYFAITKTNECKVYPIGTTPEAMIKDGVYYACPIFASLLVNGFPVTQTDVRKEPRQSIGITRTGDIIIISCDGRNFESTGMTYDDLARLHAMNGSINAYILDGGGSTATVLRGVKQNENVDYFTTDRSVGTFLYVAKETNVGVENNTANDLGRVKQFLIGQIRSLVDFTRGYIRLRGPENYYAPGLEMYVNGEDSRRSKLGLTYDPVNIRNTYLYWGLKAGETEKNNLFRIYDSGVWVQTYHGTSTTRPNGVIGLCYFDETLGKPIWYNGTRWVDATGTAV